MLARKNLLIVLVDQSFFEARSEWRPYVNLLVRKAADRGDVVLPISIHADAARVAAAFGDVNHIRAQNPAHLAEDERVYQAIYTALLRLVVDELPRVFMCHAKSKSETESYGDGERIARTIRQYIYEETQLGCFFDLHDIPHGHEVRRSIEEAIGKSVILAVWTDRLLNSPWCQFELIEARRQQRPMVILDALATDTPRLFPFLGNMPVVCWQGNCAAVVSALLLEVLRTHHLHQVFDSLCGSELQRPLFGLHPPDLLDTALRDAFPAQKEAVNARVQNADLFVYPDPPIKSNELVLLQTLIPSRRFLSLVEWRALRAARALNAPWDMSTDCRPSPFRGLSIGISVSAADTWADMGLIRQHQDELTSDIALELILLGAKVMWGGDLRPDGFGSQLRRIVLTYQHPLHATQDHVGLFVPFSPDPARVLDLEALQTRRMFADVRVLGCPLPSCPKYDVASERAKSQTAALAALAFSIMRVELASACDARVVLGGSLRTFQGLYPGIAEEAFEAVRKRRPLYVLAGFGGAARAIYESIKGLQSGRRMLINVSNTVGAAADGLNREEHHRLVAEIKRPDLEFDPKSMVKAFSNLGLAGLSKRNGLTPAENERLSESQNVHEILELLVKGISAVRRGRRR